MADKKNYWKGTTIGAIVLFLASLGVNIVDNDEGYIPYTCELESVSDMLCYKLSRVNDNDIQRNCYYDRDNSRKHKQCSTGWKMIPPDNVDMSCPVKIIAYTDDGKYYCTLVEDKMVCVDENLQSVVVP